MKRIAIIAVLCLAGCAPQARLNELVDTASGAIHRVQDSVDDIQKRWNNVQSGATLIKNGLNQLGEAVD